MAAGRRGGIMTAATTTQAPMDEGALDYLHVPTVAMVQSLDVRHGIIAGEVLGTSNGGEPTMLTEWRAFGAVMRGLINEGHSKAVITELLSDEEHAIGDCVRRKYEGPIPKWALRLYMG